MESPAYLTKIPPPIPLHIVIQHFEPPQKC